MVFGLLFIYAVVILMKLYPDAGWSLFLRRGYGIRPTGSDGMYTRGDHLRGAGVATALALVILAVAQRLPDQSRAGYSAYAYFFTFVLLGLVAALAVVIAL